MPNGSPTEAASTRSHPDCWLARMRLSAWSKNEQIFKPKLIGSWKQKPNWKMSLLR